MDSEAWGARSARRRLTLALGDASMVLLVTLIGFASHQELDPAAAGRMLATWLPFTASWCVIASLLGLYRLGTAGGLRDVWRVGAAALFASALGAWLRSLWLHSGLVPIFVLVMTGVTTLAMSAWRSLFAWAAGRPQP